jgi:hypothetical protein
VVFPGAGGPDWNRAPRIRCCTGCGGTGSSRPYWRLPPDGAALADTAPADPGFTNPEFTKAGFINAVPEGSA